MFIALRIGDPIPVDAPVAAGGIADQTYTENEAITSLDVSADFTGSGITYALAPSSAALPAGLSLSSAGVLSGTPTAEGVAVAIVVRGTNASGFDDTAFNVTVDAPAVDNSTYQLQVEAATYDVDLVNFPARIDLSFAPTEWWDEVARTDGGDIRVFDVTDTAIPFAIYDIDTVAKTGWLVATQTITTAAVTVYKLVANNDAGMALLAVDAVGGRNDAWGGFDAAYLFRGDFSDETGNGRTLVGGSTTPVIVANATGVGLAGAVSNEAATGFLSYANDPAFDDQDFEMFGIGACLVDSGGNQMLMSVVNSTSSNTTRRLIGIRDDGRNYTYFTDEGASSWHEGRGVVADEIVSLGFSGVAVGTSEVVDGLFYVDGAYANGVDAGQGSADSLQVLSGRGTSSSTDWRGECYIALFSLTGLRGNDWHRALHENFRQTRGLFQPGEVINPVVGLQ